MTTTPRRAFCIITLGCKVNQYESQALREAWLASGMVESREPAGASVICINSCAVTAKAVADVRAAVSRAFRAAPAARIVVTGCAAQVFEGELAALPGVSWVVPQENKADLLHFPPFLGESFAFGLEAAGAGRGRGEPEGKEKALECGGRAPLCPGRPLQADSSAAQRRAVYPPFAIGSYDRSRAVLKVQDGCSHHCAYCIVPFSRGPSRSRPPEETLAEAKRLLRAGFRELIVNGVNLAQYGRDLRPRHDFWDLVDLLEREMAPEWAGRARLRLSSLEPGQLGERALESLGRSRLVAPHLHLSLQSGSTSVLRRMGRGHYSPDGLCAFFADLQHIWPIFGLGADILTGFPGESSEEASTTEALCKALPFSYAHVFPYSKRPGTVAAGMVDQVPPAEKKDRAARLRSIFAAAREAFLQRNAALPVVMVAGEEGPRPGGINELYVECRFSGPVRPQDPCGGRELLAAKPVAVENGSLVVTALS